MCKLIYDIIIGIIAGLISGFKVSMYYEKKNKKKEMQNNLNLIINSLPLLAYFLGHDVKKTQENANEINMLITEWKLTLGKLQSDIGKLGYLEESKIIEDIIEKLDDIAKKCSGAKNGFIELTRWDIKGIWVRLTKIRLNITTKKSNRLFFLA